MYKKKRKIFGGRIELDTKFLLKIFDLEGGEIHSIQLDDYLPHKTITLVIEHSDLPEVTPRFPVPDVLITHQITYGDNGVPTRIERVDPPKRGKK